MGGGWGERHSTQGHRHCGPASLSVPYTLTCVAGPHRFPHCLSRIQNTIQFPDPLGPFAPLKKRSYWSNIKRTCSDRGLCKVFVARKLIQPRPKRAFALQHRLGELLASACKDYARNGGCKMFSASQEGHRIRVLEFREGEKRSVIAYMLQDNDAGVAGLLGIPRGSLSCP